MKKILFIFAWILALFFTGSTVRAEEAYVTDSIKITLRTGPSIENRVISMLSSGQALEMMESEGDWSHVRYVDEKEEMKEGWVLTRFIIDRMPWQKQALSLEAENASLKKNLNPTKKDLNEALGREQQINEKLKQTNRALLNLKKEFEALKKGASGYLDLKKEHENTLSKLTSVQEQLKQVMEENLKLRSSQRHKWFLVGSAVLFSGLIIGLVLGRREKKRHSSRYY